MTALLLALLISTGIAHAALQRDALTPAGAAWALACGTLVLGLGGVGPGAALIGFFVTSTALSRHQQAEKLARAGAVLEKGRARDGTQVLANGGVAALCCVLHALSGWAGFLCAAVASLAAATADTWATEIGLLSHDPPRLILGLRVVPRGTSGAITSLGLSAMAAGALFIALLGVIFSIAGHRGPVLFLIIAAAGTFGGLVDSVLGATVQERRACPRCEASTEQKVHRCGTATVHAAGIAGIDNDAVNFLCTAAAATWAAVLWGLIGR